MIPENCSLDPNGRLSISLDDQVKTNNLPVNAMGIIWNQCNFCCTHLWFHARFSLEKSSNAITSKLRLSFSCKCFLFVKFFSYQTTIWNDFHLNVIFNNITSETTSTFIFVRTSHLRHRVTRPIASGTITFVTATSGKFQPTTARTRWTGNRWLLPPEVRSSTRLRPRSEERFSAAQTRRLTLAFHRSVKTGFCFCH
jgi:hypothetical protein